MEVHIEIARDLRYWKKEFCDNLVNRYNILGRKLTKLKRNWQTF